MMQHDDLRKDIELGTQVLSRNIEIPPYVGIRVAIDDADPTVQSKDGRIIIHKDRVFTVEEYSNEYHANKKKGFSWINLNFAGLYENDLIILISYPRKSANVSSTSVNFSGPCNNVETGLPDWDFMKKHVFV